SVKDTGTKSGEQQRLTPVPTKIAEGTEEDATIPSSLTDAKAYTRPPGLKVTVRSQKTATSQATTTATTPGIQIFKNRRSKRLSPPATSGSSSTTPGVPANLATTPGYETGPSPGVTPVFTEAQIEAIMRGDLTGIPEARHVDIEERLYPVSPADLERQVHRALQFHLTDDQASFALPLRDLELTRLPSAIWRIRRRTLSSRRHYLDLALGGHHIESTPAPLDGRSQNPESLSPGAVDSNDPLEAPTVELPFLGLNDDELLSMVSSRTRAFGFLTQRADQLAHSPPHVHGLCQKQLPQASVPLPAGGPRVCSIASGVVGAITRGQARASEPPQEPPEAKTIKGVNPKDPSKLPRTPDRYLDGETPVSEGLEDSRVERGPAPAAEGDGVSPLKLPPYYDDTYAVPDPVLRKEQARDPFTISMKAYLEDKALPLEEWLMKVVTRTSEHYEVKDQVLYRRVILKSPIRNPRLNLVPVIPISMTTDVLALCHDSPLSGHFGRERTLE
ncbi:hypothetical protein DYB25_012257, partial [Aphanomyces astaci]